jgi:PAS domain S-box-containing protein
MRACPEAYLTQPTLVSQQMPGRPLELTALDIDKPSATFDQALELYRAIFMKSTEAIAITDPTGHYLEQNAAHAKLLGYADADLRDHTPAIHLGDAEFQSIVDELARTGACRRECVSRTSAGTEIMIELSSFAVRDKGGSPICFVGIKRDISEEKRAAFEIRQKLNELQAIYRMVDAVARADALEDIYSVALVELENTVHADRASILLFDAHNVMRFRAWRGLSDEYRRAVDGHSPWSADARNPEPVLVSDVTQDASLSAFVPLFEKEGIAALGFIPLVDAGKLLGKFMIYFDKPHVVQSNEVRLAQTIASHIAFAISRKKAETEAREAAQIQKILAEAGGLLNSSLDYDETLASVSKLVVPAIADWCFVDLVARDGGFDRISAAGPDGLEDLARKLKRHYGPLKQITHGVSQVLGSGKPELMETVDDRTLESFSRDADHFAMLKKMGLSSYICAPMITRGRITGALTLVVGSSGRRFDQRDCALTEELARRVALAVENARLYRDAQEANLAKSEFLTRMSHELRTPLNAIGGYAELMEMELHGPVTEEQRQDISRIQRSQKHLLGLINDLLSFARIETGHLELRDESVSIEDALVGVEVLVAPQIRNKSLNYRRERTAEGIECRGDRDKIGQVLLNLLSNSVKFTSNGRDVSVDWTVTASKVSIHVSDTGPGIPPEKLEAIFEPFVQLKGSPGQVAEGTGLGLAISRELARAMGGDVTVRSQHGKGSTFTLTLPRS